MTQAMPQIPNEIAQVVADLAWAGLRAVQPAVHTTDVHQTG